jgi:hypothetical protein
LISSAKTVVIPVLHICPEERHHISNRVKPTSCLREKAGISKKRGANKKLYPRKK